MAAQVMVVPPLLLAAQVMVVSPLLLAAQVMVVPPLPMAAQVMVVLQTTLVTVPVALVMVPPQAGTPRRTAQEPLTTNPPLITQVFSMEGSDSEAQVTVAQATVAQVMVA
eukprot:gb/GEZN01036613.1/.p2 GENE.gb/GEZN01036613.1/~~gb/GEZN01036613.1/.p2  ORF type:complete len:110 (+),score=3.75 gb/GEZN01036613.1/:2-331(+)